MCFEPSRRDGEELRHGAACCCINYNECNVVMLLESVSDFVTVVKFPKDGEVCGTSSRFRDCQDELKLARMHSPSSSTIANAKMEEIQGPNLNAGFNQDWIKACECAERGT